MPGYLVQVGATLQCAHTGQVSIVSSNARVTSDNVPLGMSTDSFLVAGCQLSQSGLSPCIDVLWPQPAQRVFINNLPALLSTATTQTDGAVPAPAVVIMTQLRVWGI